MLSDVLALAKPRIDPDVNNAQLRLFVTATGSDGYRAVVAWAEIDVAFSGKRCCSPSLRTASNSTSKALG